jgi:hypothetical protein
VLSFEKKGRLWLPKKWEDVWFGKQQGNRWLSREMGGYVGRWVPKKEDWWLIREMGV